MKKLLIGLLVLLLVAVGALLAAPGLVDWNQYRDEIARRVSAATGRELVLDGGIDLALLPRPTLRVSEARLASVPGAAEPDTVRLKQLDVRVAMMPLLSGDIQVESVTLVEPVIVMEVLPDGRRTWDFSAASSVNAGPLGSKGLLDAVSLDRLAIEDGTVVYRNAVTGTAERLDDVDASVAAASLTGPFQVEATFRARGVPMSTELTAGRIGEGGAMPLRAVLGLAGTDASLRFAGIATTDSTPRLQGDLRAGGTDLRGPAEAVLAAFGLGPSQQTPAQQTLGGPRLHPLPKVLEQPFDLRTAVNASAAALELNAIEVQVGDTRGTGTVKLTSGDASASDTGTTTPDRAEIALGFNRFDLDAWLPLIEAAALPAEAGTGTFTLPTDLEARIALSVDALGYNKGIVRQGRVEAGLSEGVLTIERAGALLPGASDVALAGTVTAGTGAPEFDLRAEANSDSLRSVLEWLQLDPAGVPADRLHKFSASGRLTGQPDSFQVSGLDLRLDTSVASGAVAYVDRGRPGLGIRLDLDRLNLDAYTGIAVAATDTADTDNASTDGETAEPNWLHRLDLGTILGAVDANIEASVGALTAGGIPVRDARLDATVAGGALTLRRFTAAELSGAAVDLRGAVAGIERLEGIDLTFDLSAESLAPVYRGLNVEPLLPAEQVGPVTLSGRISGDPQRLAIEADLDAAGGTVQAGGMLSGIRQIPNYDLKVRATWPRAGDLFGVLWPEWEPADPGDLDLYAEVQGSDTALTLSAIQGTVAGEPVTGELTADLAGERPSLVADLQTGELVLDRFLPAATSAWLPSVPLPVSQAIAAESGLWPDEPLDLAWLGLADIDLGLNASALVHGERRLEEPALRARIDEGTLTVEQLEAGFADGRLGLTGTLAETDTGTTDLAARLSLLGARLENGLAGGRTDAAVDLTGALDLDLDVTASGANPAALVAALDGSGSLTVAEGRLTGLDLDGLAERIEATGKEKNLGAALNDMLTRTVAKGRTPLQRLETSFELEGGIARLQSLEASLPEAEIAGTGTIDLADWMMELALRIDPQGDAPPFALALAGPVDRPQRAVTSDALSAWLIERTAAAIVPVQSPAPAPTPAPRPARPPQMADDSPAQTPEPEPEPAGNSVIDGILDRLRQ